MINIPHEKIILPSNTSSINFFYKEQKYHFTITINIKSKHIYSFFPSWFRFLQLVLETAPNFLIETVTHHSLSLVFLKWLWHVELVPSKRGLARIPSHFPFFFYFCFSFFSIIYYLLKILFFSIINSYFMIFIKLINYPSNVRWLLLTLLIYLFLINNSCMPFLLIKTKHIHTYIRSI